MIGTALGKSLSGTGAVDNAVLRADGTAGDALQNSGLVVEDTIVSVTGITGDAGTDVITAPGTAFANGQPVRFTALTGGTGLNTTTNYFVREVSGATFKVETSIGGGAINFTTNITAGTLLTGHSVSTNVTLSENTTETNSALVLTPKGTGALIAGPKPDGTSTGGNARGARAVDLQTDRNSSNQVASGANSVICGGLQNRASGTRSAVVGGSANLSSSSDSFIGGGLGCIASGAYSFVGGGNQCTATADFSGVASGFVNIASNQNAFVGGGLGNSASGFSSVVSGGGASSLGNGATNSYSSVLGGLASLANRYAMQAHAGGQFSAQGDAQRARFVLRCKTTTNAAVEMALDGSTTYLTIPSGKVMFVNIKVVGVRSDGSTVASYERQYAAKNVAGTSSEVFAPVTIGTDLASGTTLEVATVDAGDYIRIRPTGVASQIWRWVASVDAVEVAYGT